MSTLRRFGLLGIFGLLAGCGQVPLEHQASNTVGMASMSHVPIAARNASDNVADNATREPDPLAYGSTDGTLQTGHASWYARKFEGRRTASGERYDARALTAAHRTLPLGSYVRVTSLHSGKSVVVRINDRGPFIKGRVIDLSYAAANEIGLIRMSSMRVQIERVKKMADTRTAPDESES